MVGWRSPVVGMVDASATQTLSRLRRRPLGVHGAGSSRPMAQVPASWPAPGVRGSVNLISLLPGMARVSANWAQACFMSCADLSGWVIVWVIVWEAIGAQLNSEDFGEKSHESNTVIVHIEK